jgi:hypothetical protein
MPCCELPGPERCDEVFLHSIAHKYMFLALFPTNIKYVMRALSEDSFSESATMVPHQTRTFLPVRLFLRHVSSRASAAVSLLSLARRTTLFPRKGIDTFYCLSAISPFLVAWEAVALMSTSSRIDVGPYPV